MAQKPNIVHELKSRTQGTGFGILRTRSYNPILTKPYKSWRSFKKLHYFNNLEPSFWSYTPQFV